MAVDLCRNIYIVVYTTATTGTWMAMRKESSAGGLMKACTSIVCLASVASKVPPQRAAVMSNDDGGKPSVVAFTAFNTAQQ